MPTSRGVGVNMEHDVLLSGILVFLPLKSGSSLRQITVSFCTVQRAENRAFQTRGQKERDRQTDRQTDRDIEKQREREKKKKQKKGKEKLGRYY